MQNFKSLLVLPVGIGIVTALIVPGLLGIFLGVLVMLIYFAFTVARASDWR